ncbi:hypothetical protein J7297_02021 [Nakaseomyces glabratus]|nr:hypothetical protein J7297_02021 [Nakaseomyces glabratus]KAH7593483.1 hypothetical protein J7296_02023 [Nakaseomyces glabratus]
MDESQVERKKSYRWVSASQATYDGAGWDSSSESETETRSQPKLGKLDESLPSLPKLNYDNTDVSQYKEEDDEDTDNRTEKAGEIGAGTLHSNSEIQNDVIAEDDPVIRQTPDMIDKDTLLTSPTAHKESSPSPNGSRHTFSRRPLPNRAVNEHLDDLMLEISKELTPKPEQEAVFGNHSPRKDIDSDLPNGKEDQKLNGSRLGLLNESIDNESDMPSVDETRSKDVDENGEKDREDRFDYYDDDSEFSIDSEIKQAQKASLEELQSEFDSDPQTSNIAKSLEGMNLEHDAEEESVKTNRDSNVSDLQKDQREINESNIENSDNDSLELPLTESSSDELESADHGDALSFTESIQYDQSDGDSEPNQGDDASLVSNRVQQNNVNTDAESADDIAKDKIDDHASGMDFEEDEVLNSTLTDGDVHVHKSGYFKKLVAEELGDKKLDDGKSLNNVASTQTASTEDKVSSDTEDVQESKADNDDTKNDAHVSSNRSSVTSEEWRPDTDALRDGFMQKTGDNPPPGFVRDEKGELVDLTPASMKPRVVSTYSEIESTWNAFPSEDADDLETIRDTKTLYDNSTLYNVPGIMTNNDALPPLPEDASLYRDSNQSDAVGSQDRARAASVTRKVSKEGVNIAQPTSQEINKLSEQNTMPTRDLNKIISSNSTHAIKLENLRDYRNTLDNFDSGLQTWIAYTLKSSSKTDRDFIFQEYKSNSHVREAYANADDLSRKNTVINTVTNVNQNVNHLRKKVLQHSLKPKTLFSSISKKKL